MSLVEEFKAFGKGCGTKLFGGNKCRPKQLCTECEGKKKGFAKCCQSMLKLHIEYGLAEYRVLECEAVVDLAGKEGYLE